MNYRHLYHAGNFADVFKHIVLTLLLQALARKESPYAYFETHAGTGRYDLRHPAAAKTGEYRDGIGRLWAAPDLPDACAAYRDAVRALNGDGHLRFYPGSPRIAHTFLRPSDRMVLAELHPYECERLKGEFAHVPRAAVHCQDGLAALKGWVPPVERRGLVLIDPPYERDEEWEQVGAAVARAVTRWPTGVYALWYPIKAHSLLGRMTRPLASLPAEKLLSVTLHVYPPDTPFKLNGCGMMIVNPPWQLDTQLESLLPWLAERLRQASAAAGRVEQGLTPGNR